MEVRVAVEVVADSSHLATEVLTKVAHHTSRAVAAVSAKLVARLTHPTVRTTHHRRAWAATAAQCPNTQRNQRNSNGAAALPKSSPQASEAIIMVRRPASHLSRTKVVVDQAHTKVSRLIRTARLNHLLICPRSRVLGVHPPTRLSKIRSPLKTRRSEWLSLNHQTLTIRRRKKNQKRNQRKLRLKLLPLLRSRTC